MKNIQNLILINFQQWKTGIIKFKPGLNIIIGDTESGKSTLFRAINSVLTGKMPEDYIRKGTKGCEVEIKFSDNTVFKRLRNKKDNKANADGLIFERVGKEIPFEYFNKLGNTSIEFGSKELSLCSYSQFEPHFFITLSDYDKSKLIGTICGIDIVDKLMDLINKDIRTNNTNIKFLEQQISEQESEKEIKIPEFEAVDKKMNCMIELKNKIDTQFNLLEYLSYLKSKLITLQSEIKQIKSQLNIIQSKICSFDTQVASKLNHLQQLKTNLMEINYSILAADKIRVLLDKKQSFNFNIVNLFDDLAFLKDKLITYNKNIEELNFSKQQLNQQLTILTNQKKDLLKDYDTCPLCGGIL